MNILTTTRLELVPFARGHGLFLHGLWTDPLVRRFLWDDREISRNEAAEIIEASIGSFGEKGFGFWVIVDVASGDAIGFAGLREFGDQQDVELLYGLSPQWWGRGLATEASQCILDFAFDTCGLPRLYAGSDPPNTASIQVIERLGMNFDSRRIINGVETLYFVLDRDSRRGLACRER